MACVIKHPRRNPEGIVTIVNPLDFYAIIGYIQYMTNTTLKIWNEMTPDELRTRLAWIQNDDNRDNPDYDDEYYDIIFTLMVSEEADEV